ncbi:MAG: class I SAM-dependent methyltransferase [Actinobacteria bacterium]|nr:class I SAM-dependent methyltransferase [Actinomycetota bacterium]MCL5444747.1 class I SAM-dependent methyltransferase [Actinomycetota bacterium]
MSESNPPRGDRSERTLSLITRARATRGFMPDDEGEALLDAALRAGTSRDSLEEIGGQTTGRRRCFVEIGAWCGKSTIYLGAAGELSGAVVFSVDHHHGSEENQRGWEHHEEDLVDPHTQQLETLFNWRRSIEDTRLSDVVIGVIGDSVTIAKFWNTPIDLCFIDGGHGEEPAWADFKSWGPHVRPGGWLAIHDVFLDPRDGGRPPFDIWCAALESGDWIEDGECGSLRVLRRRTT